MAICWHYLGFRENCGCHRDVESSAYHVSLTLHGPLQLIYNNLLCECEEVAVIDVGYISKWRNGKPYIDCEVYTCIYW